MRLMRILAVICLLAAALAQGSPAFSASTENKKGLLPLGSQAPDFSLPDVVTGKTVTLADFSDKKALAVIFICRHCPYVQHVKESLAKLGRDYKDKNVAIVAISANDAAAYPDDSPESLAEMARAEGFAFPFLHDDTQKVAQAYTAVCTPDIFVFNGKRELVYRGQFDGTRPFTPQKASGKDLRDAIEAVLADKPVSANQKPAVGCSIKWKSGNEPAYF